MIINYNIPKINQCLKDFYHATGIHMDLLREDFSFVSDHTSWKSKRYCAAIQNTEKGKTACLCSDAALLRKSRASKKVEMQVCHAGLIDVSVPILYDDAIIGYIIFGQIKTDTDFGDLRGYLLRLGLPETEMKSYYDELSPISRETLHSLSNIAEILVKHILFEHMLKPNFDEGIQRALNYIHKNLDADLSVQSISKNANISKSALYRRFQSIFRCTVSEYVNEKRIEKAAELLQESHLSIEEISRTVGFAGGSYFSKTFKKKKGISPIQYRNANKKI